MTLTTKYLMFVVGNEATGELLEAYLVNSDVDAHDGIGTVQLSRMVEDAKRFDTVEELLDCWKQQSSKRPLRPDGEPNRPLTAYTVSPVMISEELT